MRRSGDFGGDCVAAIRWRDRFKSGSNMFSDAPNPCRLRYRQYDHEEACEA